MSMWIVHLEKRCAHVVVDSVGAMRVGENHIPQLYTAKMNVLPHLGCALTGRGDSYYFQTLYTVINRLPLFGFDDVAENLREIACQAALLQQQHAAEGWAPPVCDRQEVLAAGFSQKRRRPELHGFIRWHGQEVTSVQTEGTWLGPDVPESRGIIYRPRIKVPVVDLAALARKQFEASMTDPDVRGEPAVGGQIVYAGISAEGVTTRILGQHKNHAECVEKITAGEFYESAIAGLAAAGSAGWPLEG